MRTSNSIQVILCVCVCGSGCHSTLNEHLHFLHNFGLFEVQAYERTHANSQWIGRIRIVEFWDIFKSVGIHILWFRDIISFCQKAWPIEIQMQPVAVADAFVAGRFAPHVYLNESLWRSNECKKHILHARVSYRNLLTKIHVSDSINMIGISLAVLCSSAHTYISSVSVAWFHSVPRDWKTTDKTQHFLSFFVDLKWF